MKEHIEELLRTALIDLQKQANLTIDSNMPIVLERTRDPQYGDFASNLALVLAKPLARKPRELAEQLVALLPTSTNISKVEIAGPGFINFYLKKAAFQAIVKEVLNNPQYGQSHYGKGEPIQIEFVSSNPTGPLHVGHGRSAAYGASLANLLAAIGYKVHKEYYVNDAGRQMDILTVSVWLRYLQLFNEQFAFPRAGYQGDYIVDIATELKTEHGADFRYSIADIYQDIPPDALPEVEDVKGEKEIHINALIKRAKELLGAQGYKSIFNKAITTILADIREDLSAFGVEYDEWFSEQSLQEQDAVTRAINTLQTGGHLYEKEGATWFRSSAFGDDKDRVLIRSNGDLTYFATDIANHFNKFARGYKKVINVLGADHHGYVPRLKAAVCALGIDTNALTIPMVQFAILYRGNQRVQMSTRSGSFVTLRELREEVGNDAARFFYIMRKSEQHMDFDLELAKSQSNDNPVYYIQYAHARICSVFRQLGEKNYTWDRQQGLENLHLLEEEHEHALLADLVLYPEIVETAALAYEPHQLAHYLRNLANDFHTYYNAHQFLVPEESLRNARLCLIAAVRQVLAHGLQLIGVKAPQTM
jgi:arginyl-tRNA synthetase